MVFTKWNTKYWPTFSKYLLSCLDPLGISIGKYLIEIITEEISSLAKKC
jgi:hypothetical protein